MDFTDLPREMYICIFELFEPVDFAMMRIAYKFCKEIIDTHKFPLYDKIKKALLQKENLIHYALSVYRDYTTILNYAHEILHYPIPTKYNLGKYYHTDNVRWVAMHSGCTLPEYLTLTFFLDEQTIMKYIAREKGDALGKMILLYYSPNPKFKKYVYEILSKNAKDIDPEELCVFFAKTNDVQLFLKYEDVVSSTQCLNWAVKFNALNLIKCIVQMNFMQAVSIRPFYTPEFITLETVELFYKMGVNTAGRIFENLEPYLISYLYKIRKPYLITYISENLVHDTITPLLEEIYKYCPPENENLELLLKYCPDQIIYGINYHTSDYSCTEEHISVFYQAIKIYKDDIYNYKFLFLRKYNTDLLNYEHIIAKCQELKDIETEKHIKDIVIPQERAYKRSKMKTRKN